MDSMDSNTSASHTDYESHASSVNNGGKHMETAVPLRETSGHRMDVEFLRADDAGVPL